MDYLFIYRDTS